MIPTGVDFGCQMFMHNERKEFIGESLWKRLLDSSALVTWGAL